MFSSVSTREACSVWTSREICTVYVCDVHLRVLRARATLCYACTCHFVLCVHVPLCVVLACIPLLSQSACTPVSMSSLLIARSALRSHTVMTFLHLGAPEHIRSTERQNAIYDAKAQVDTRVAHAPREMPLVGDHNTQLEYGDVAIKSEVSVRLVEPYTKYMQYW